MTNGYNLLQGMNGNDNNNLDIERIRNFKYSVVQLSGGCVVGGNANVLFIGDFIPLLTFLGRSRSLIEQTLENGISQISPQSHIAIEMVYYIQQVLAHSYCYSVIGEAGWGILPGVDLATVTSY